MHNGGDMRRICALAVLLAAGCARRGLPEFPIGLYAVDTPEDARIAREAGFDALQSYQTGPAALASLARAARREGMTMLVGPDELISSGAATRGWPVAAWYVQDEPDVSGVTPAELAAHEKKIRAWDPGTPTAFVVGIGTAAARYAATGDALMVDWYPVPHLPLESVGAQVRDVAAVAGARPVWAVLQAMNWMDFPQHDPKKPRIGRFPDRAEIRFMSYDAVINGAQGVWYFTYSTATGCNLSQTPDRLDDVAVTARELRALAPVFASGRPIALPFADVPGGPAARAWTYHGRDYVVLAARGAGVDVLFPPELLNPDWRPLFEARRDLRELLREYEGGWYLRQHRVLVLESRLSPRRLLGL